MILISSRWQNSHRKAMYQELQKALSKWSDVVFVQAPYSVIVHGAMKRNSFSKYEDHNEAKDFPLQMMTPKVIFHNKIWSKSEYTYGIDSKLISSQLNNYIEEEHSGKHVILWACHPFDYNYLRNVKAAIRVYDFYDNFSYDENGELNAFKDKLNRKLICNSDIIFCTSKTMFGYAQGLGANARLIPNGYSMNSEEIISAGMFPQDEHIIGYIGTVRDWIDFDLISSLLSGLKPGQYLAFVGPVAPNARENVRRLKTSDKFIHIGEVEYTDVFSYIRSFSVGIIPFKRNKFMDGVFPNKFFEYVACGIPIVSTNLPDINDLREFVNVADSNGEFVEMCKSDPRKLIFGRSFYEHLKTEATWGNRVRRMEECLMRSIEEKAVHV